MKLTTIAAASLVALALATSTQAAMHKISTIIKMSASNSDITVDYVNNTVVFAPPVPTVNAQVDVVSGDLSGILFPADSIKYQSFTYSPYGVSNPLWSNLVGDIKFDLLSITPGSIIETANTFGVAGSGMLYAPGFDPTPALWSFSGSRTSDSEKFAWSSTTSSVVRGVPDGGTTFVLMGAALLGLGGVRRLFPAIRK